MPADVAVAGRFGFAAAAASFSVIAEAAVRLVDARSVCGRVFVHVEVVCRQRWAFGVSSGFRQRFRDFRMSIISRKTQGGAIFAFSVNVRAGSYQRLCDLRMTVIRCNVKRRRIAVSFSIDISASGYQRLHSLHMTIKNRGVQG